MTLTQNSIGQKIKYFRKRSGLSQSVLELEINAAPGSISRIESGQVNPTKETVIQIAEALHLHYREVDYLIGLTANPATEQEIQKAFLEVEDYFNKNVFAYLIDERWRLFKASNLFVKALGIDHDYINKNQGISTIEFITNEELGILDRFSSSKMEQMLRYNLQYYYKEVGFMQDDETFQSALDAIRKNKIAARLWDEILSQKDDSYSIRDGRVVYFNVFRKVEIPFVYNYEPLLNSTRFQIVVWTPMNEYLKLVTDLFKL